MANDPSKTEKATPKRIEKTRKEGNVAKSQEVSKAAGILAGVAILSFWLEFIAHDLMDIFRYFMTQAPTFQVNDGNLSALIFWLAAELAKMLAPILFFLALVAYLSMRIQVGKLWSTKAFAFKLSKLNPISGLKRMFFSLQTFMRLFKSLLQAVFIGIAPWIIIKAEITLLPTLYDMTAAGVAVYILETASRMVMYALIPMIGIAVFDFWNTRREYANNLKMSKDEVKDEHKQSEGDPHLKSKIRQKMQQLTGKRMMSSVPLADVIITNPTHIAVALMYDQEQAAAPIVVAIGVNRVAEKIREIARENNVPIRENKPLARSLYKQTKVGDVIPAELFQAVAVILAQIWKTKPKKPQGKTILNRP